MLRFSAIRISVGGAAYLRCGVAAWRYSAEGVGNSSGLGGLVQGSNQQVEVARKQGRPFLLSYGGCGVTLR